MSDTNNLSLSNPKPPSPPVAPIPQPPPSPTNDLTTVASNIVAGGILAILQADGVNFSDPAKQRYRGIISNMLLSAMNEMKVLKS